jgi:hypothetical protein
MGKPRRRARRQRPFERRHSDRLLGTFHQETIGPSLKRCRKTILTHATPTIGRSLQIFGHQDVSHRGLTKEVGEKVRLSRVLGQVGVFVGLFPIQLRSV